MEEKNLSASLVVVGGGGAGLAAAVAAAESGIKNIVVLEKRDITGGTSAMASGPFGAESPAQRRQAIIADREELFKRAMAWSHLKANPRIVRAFIDKSGDTISWLEKMGLYFYCVPHSPVDNPLTWHVPRGDGAEIMRALSAECSKLGVTVHLRTEVRKLMVGPQGNIIVVATAQEGSLLNISAGSVVISTGGFGGNKALLRKYCPDYRESMRVSGLPNTGDGLMMAIEIGAATDGLGMLMMAGPVAGGTLDLGNGPGRVRLSLTFITGEPFNVWVNKKGRRFIDETAVFNYYESINALVRQPDSISYALFDSKMVGIMSDRGLTNVAEGYGYGGLQRSPLPGGLEEGLKQQAARGGLVISDSWDDIADWIGSEREILKATVDDYNQACDQGYDPVFAKSRNYLVPLRQPPYYSVQCGSTILNTMGGIKVNERMEVLDRCDSPIPGLFAAGVDTGGWTSDTYCAMLPGTALGYAFNSGRIAGESAAKFVIESKKKADIY